jgi:hypothetical protein
MHLDILRRMLWEWLLLYDFELQDNSNSNSEEFDTIKENYCFLNGLHLRYQGRMNNSSISSSSSSSSVSGNGVVW